MFKTSFLSLVLFFSFSSVEAAERPDLDIQIGSVFVCLEGRSLSGPLYSDYCSQRPDVHRTAYFSFVPGEKVLFMLDSFHKNQLGTVENWCSSEINDGRYAPSCVFRVSRAHDYTGKSMLLPVKEAAGNLFSLDLSSLELGVEFHIQLVEAGSGSMAVSQVVSLKH